MLIIVNRCDCSGTISSAGLRQDTDRKVDGENSRFRNLVGRSFLFSQLTSNGTASPGGPLACWGRKVLSAPCRAAQERV